MDTAVVYTLLLAARMPTQVYDLTASLPPLWTFTRASSGTQVQSGILSTVGNNVARFETSPVGYLNEPQATNIVRNSTIVGAVAGTPGTDPTNWTVTGATNGLTKTLVGTGTENGITYVDYRYFGTTTAASQLRIYPDGNGGLWATTNGSVVSQSYYLKLAAGSLSSLQLFLAVDIQDSAHTFLEPSNSTNLIGSVGSGSLVTQRVDYSVTVANASAAFLASFVYFSIPTLTVVDFTIRIGGPQFENGAFPTSYIATTTAAATRAADNLTLDLTQLPNLQTPAGYGVALEFSVIDNNQPGVVYFGVSIGTDPVNTWYMRHTSFGGSTARISSWVAGTVASSSFLSLRTAGLINRAAFSVTPAGIRWVLNGSAVTNLAKPGQPVMTNMVVGRMPWDNTNFAAMHATTVTLIPGPQSDAWLSEMAY